RTPSSTTFRITSGCDRIRPEPSTVTSPKVSIPSSISAMPSSFPVRGRDAGDNVVDVSTIPDGTVSPPCSTPLSEGLEADDRGPASGDLPPVGGAHQLVVVVAVGPVPVL